MRRFRYMFLGWSCIIALALLLAQSTAVEASGQRETPQKTPPRPTDISSVVGTFFGSAALSSNNIWAVGTSMNIPQFTGQPLIEHWNGSAWQIVPGPATPQDNLSNLVSISAVGNNNIWAAGFSMNATNHTSQPLIEHWNGKSWQIIPGPSNVKEGALSALNAVGANDIWAVGSTASSANATSDALIEHWDGSSWQVIPAASSTENTNLLSITAVSANNIWAVGSSFSNKESKALIEHWDGRSWQSIPTATSSVSFTKLSGVTALSANDIWAVGNSLSAASQVLPVIQHWDGNSWNDVSPSDLPASFTPVAIDALHNNDIWIAGAQAFAHWDGKQWQSFSTTSQKGFKFLNAITLLAHDDAWAVGSDVTTTSALPLIEHWNGKSWQPVSNPALALKKPAQGKVLKNVTKPKHK